MGVHVTDASVMDSSAAAPTAQHWDPFDGTLAVAPEDAGRPAKVILPEWFERLQGPLFLVAMLGFALIFILDGDLGWFVGGGLAAGGIMGALYIPLLTGAEARRRAHLRDAATSLGFAFRETIPRARLGTMRSALADLFMLRVGGSIPIIVQSEMWGRAPDGVPMWLAADVIPSKAYFGGPKQDTSDGSGTRSGNVVMMLAAYQLDRDTGIEVKLLPEFVSSIGPLDRDIKTESIAFNARFNVRMRMLDDGSVPDGATVELLRVLSPALQTTLLALADRFAARVIIRGRTVYFAGFHNIRTLDTATMARLIDEVVSGFAEAASSFKHYAE